MKKVRTLELELLEISEKFEKNRNVGDVYKIPSKQKSYSFGRKNLSFQNDMQFDKKNPYVSR